MMENILKHWSGKKTFTEGTIVVINSLALSLIVYSATVLCIPTINSLIYQFLWDGKKDPKYQKSD